MSNIWWIMTCKVLGRKRCWPNRSAILAYAWGHRGWRWNFQYSQFSGQCSIFAPSECKSKVFARHQPTCLWLLHSLFIIIFASQSIMFAVDTCSLTGKKINGTKQKELKEAKKKKNYASAINKKHLRVYNGGTRWRSWLRHCATSRKVAGSIPDGVIEILLWHNPSGRTMALGLTLNL